MDILLSLIVFIFGFFILKSLLAAMKFMESRMTNSKPIKLAPILTVFHIVAFVLLFIFIWLITSNVNHERLSDIFILFDKEQLVLFGKGFLITCIPVIIISILFKIIYKTQYKLNSTNPLMIFYIMLIYIVATFFQAGSEELWLRTYILKHFGDVVGLKFAVVITAVMFVLIHLVNKHYDKIALIGCSLFGLMFGWSVIATKSVSMAIGLHSGWNFTAAILFSGLLSTVTDKNGKRLSIFNAAEGSILGLVVIALTTILVLLTM